MRYPTHYAIAGTKAFRIASRTWFDGSGGNLTNPPKKTLSIFRAPRGRLLIQPDQAGADALVVAYTAKDGNYRALFRNGIKPHAFLALHIFHVQYAEWFRDLPYSHLDYVAALPDELAKMEGWPILDKRIRSSGVPYDVGKRTAHGYNYDMQWKTYQEANLVQSEGMLVLSREQSQRFLLLCAALFPEINELKIEIEMRIRTTRVLHNLQGFPRRFDKLITPDYIRDGLSWIPASTVACITHEAIHKTQRYIEENKLDWHCVSNKHDSMATEIPAADLDHALEWHRHVMRKDLVGRDGVKFQMGSEIQYGERWCPVSKHPSGMKEHKYT